MTNAETNQRIHEAIHGEGSWHNPIKLGEYEYKCHCGFHAYDTWVATYLCSKQNPNYLEHGKPWGEMLNWAMKQEWWRDFIGALESYDDGRCFWSGAIVNLFANPRSLAEHIVEYLEKK